MIDLILIAFTAGIFAGGFWCGKTYGNTKTMVKRVLALFGLTLG